MLRFKLLAGTRPRCGTANDQSLQDEAILNKDDFLCDPKGCRRILKIHFKLIKSLVLKICFWRLKKKQFSFTHFIMLPIEEGLRGLYAMEAEQCIAICCAHWLRCITTY